MANGRSLISQLRTESGNVPIIGYMVWWNVRDVNVTSDWFKAKLNSIGIDGERYARDHNYRAAYIRCLRKLEERRIIRKVAEDNIRLVYQFTAENLIDDPNDPRLEYVPETVVEINKSIYYLEGDFANALTKCDERLKPILIKMFDKERKSYNSSDITRYLQRILNDHADLVSLRPQGSVYFVPSEYNVLISQLSEILASVSNGAAHLEYFPVPDVETSRHAVSQGVEAEIIDVLSKIDAEVTKMNSGSDEITEKWVEFRRNKINNVKLRIDRYAELLGARGDELAGKFDAINATLKPRIIEI